MKKPIFQRSLIILVAAILGFASCSKDDVGADTSTDEDSSFETNTRDTTLSNSVLIVFNGLTATVTNPFSGNGVEVAVSAADVVVTATTTTTEVNYVLSGITTNGSLKIYSEYKFGLVLNGTGITNDNGPAINIQSGKKVSVNVLSGTTNRLADGATYATSTEDQKGALFSEGQLVFSGPGNLAVTGNYKHGICSDDYIYVTAGNITVSGAVSDGIHANDYFKMDNGSLSVTSSGDGIDCEEGNVEINGGALTIKSMDDGLVASYEDSDTSITPYIIINGGTIEITTTGEKGNAIKSESYTTINSTGNITLAVSGKGAKGIKTGGDLTLTTGNIAITNTGNAFYDTEDADITAPAGINCDGNLKIDNGTVKITSTGIAGKGITVDGTLVVNDGTLDITASGAVFTYGSDESEAKGIKSDGALTINSGTISIAAADDGLKSETSITVNNGTINITKSTEGIEAPYITFNNGKVSVVSSDDCVNSTVGDGGEATDASLLKFVGGTIVLSTTAGDGIDGNGTVTMSGGTVIVQGPPSAPEVAIDVNGNFNISGGLLIASGPNAGNMIEATSSSSTQNTVLVQINGNVSAGTLFTIQNSAGTSLVTYAPVRSAYYFVYSAPELITGSTFKVLTGGSYSGGSSTGGLYTGGTFSGGTLRGSFTPNARVTTVSL